MKVFPSLAEMPAMRKNFPTIFAFRQQVSYRREPTFREAFPSQFCKSMLAKKNLPEKHFIKNFEMTFFEFQI